MARWSLSAGKRLGPRLVAGGKKYNAEDLDHGADTPQRRRQRKTLLPRTVRPQATAAWPIAGAWQKGRRRHRPPNPRPSQVALAWTMNTPAVPRDHRGARRRRPQIAENLGALEVRITRRTRWPAWKEASERYPARFPRTSSWPGRRPENNIFGDIKLETSCDQRRVGKDGVLAARPIHRPLRY